jgi:hypothetical protein
MYRPFGLCLGDVLFNETPLAIPPTRFGCYRPAARQILPKTARASPTGNQISHPPWTASVANTATTILPATNAGTGRTDFIQDSDHD